jgi:hypothetical protein
MVLIESCEEHCEVAGRACDIQVSHGPVDLVNFIETPIRMHRGLFGFVDDYIISVSSRDLKKQPKLLWGRTPGSRENYINALILYHIT